MGLETGTYIADLVPANPGATDLESQGDDHLRLIKSILQATFPTANRPFPIPQGRNISADTTLLTTDQNQFILLNTAAGVFTLTLPTLTAGDAGWMIRCMKVTADTNPVMIANAGNLLYSQQSAGVGLLRRCIPFRVFTCHWAGSIWIIDRCVGEPIGSVIKFHGTTAPVGFEFANGQTLTSLTTRYPQYLALIGATVPDYRGRVGAGKDDMGAAGAASRLTTAGSGVDGATLGAAGGTQNITFLKANLPSVGTFSMTGGTASGNVSTGTISITDGGHVHAMGYTTIQDGGSNYNAVTAGSQATRVVSQTLPSTDTQSNTSNISASPSGSWTFSSSNVAGSAQMGGSDTATKVTQPTIVCNQILVTE